MLSAVLDHLWQSTLLALGLGLLILAFRQASAAVRHGLWFAASVKFLVPFAALAALGKHLAPVGASPAGAAPEAVFPAAAFIAQAARPLARFPFSRPELVQGPLSQLPLSSAPLATAHAATPIAQGWPHPDPALILVAVWALGCAVVLARWAVRAAKVRAVVRSATALAWPAPMPVLASPSLMEPGLVGFLRPVLVVPQGLPNHLTRSGIDAILAHEICHLRRRDNLTAAIHMLVEALFWFHPLVWWIGGRLIAEREQACDEAVLEAGHDRAAYARSLVESCRLYLQSPLSCVAGASGSNLAKRVESIMTAPLSSPLSLSKKALLVAAGLCAFATPVAAGLLAPPEGGPATGPAKILAAISEPVRVLSVPAIEEPLRAPGPDASDSAQNRPEKPVVLAQNTAALAPAPSVAALDSTPTVLAQDIAAPRVEPAQAEAQPAPPAPQPAGPPLSARALAMMAAQAMDPVDAKKQALSFVQSYAAPTRQRDLIARWNEAICVRVEGLAPDQDSAVTARIDALATAVGIEAQPAGCRTANVEIRFANAAQRTLDDVIARTPQLLGDRTSPTRTSKTITRPIQAWYVTNGVEYAANRTDGLKALVAFQPPNGGPGTWTSPMLAPQGTIDGGSFPQSIPGAPPSTPRAFRHVLVIVDLQRTGTVKLGTIADITGMLALSQPRSLDRCNAVPSVTDLFAACPSGAAPAGLTPADAAYLTALYAPGPRVTEAGHETAVVERMAKLLAMSPADPEIAALSTQPAARFIPQAFHSAPAQPALPLTRIAYDTTDLETQASSFVRAYARATSFDFVIRWNNPLCVKVFGLKPDQAEAVETRIRAIADAVGVPGASGANYKQCTPYDVAVVFTTDPQRTLDYAIAHRPWVLGDDRSDTRNVKTITRPIQAWYETCGFRSCPPDPVEERLSAAMVLVDLRKTDGARLNAIADYTAMLVLSEPRSPDRCQALPSVIDLFAGPCSGRSAPTGLTLADIAYLQGVYTAELPHTAYRRRSATGQPERGVDGEHSPSLDQVASRMAEILAKPRVVVR